MAGRVENPSRPSARNRPLPGTRKEQIRKLLTKMEQRLDLDEGKVTLADFIRLTQFEREL
jgi:hypothetical protein